MAQTLRTVIVTHWGGGVLETRFKSCNQYRPGIGSFLLRGLWGLQATQFGELHCAAIAAETSACLGGFTESPVKPFANNSAKTYRTMNRGCFLRSTFSLSPDWASPGILPCLFYTGNLIRKCFPPPHPLLAHWGSQINTGDKWPLMGQTPMDPYPQLSYLTAPVALQIIRANGPDSLGWGWGSRVKHLSKKGGCFDSLWVW